MNCRRIQEGISVCKLLTAVIVSRELYLFNRTVANYRTMNDASLVQQILRDGRIPMARYADSSDGPLSNCRRKLDVDEVLVDP